jgi:phenylalanyl-tRNA synthetase beta chain
MLVSTSVTFKDIAAIVESVRPAELESWQLFDVYRGKQIEAGLQSISLSFRYRHPQAHDAENGRPLSDDEVNKAHAVIVNALNEKLGGTIR